VDFEEFVAAARAVVEKEARAHADDRWWIFEPKLVVQRRDLRVVPVSESDAARRALRTGDLAELLPALGARRVAVALHVDLAIDGEPVPAVVLAIVGGIAHAVQHARVERTEFGTPVLGPWEPSDLEESDVASALRAAVG
jgi:hypothetical protein